MHVGWDESGVAGAILHKQGAANGDAVEIEMMEVVNSMVWPRSSGAQKDAAGHGCAFGREFGLLSSE